jgi:hypothetical protein
VTAYPMRPCGAFWSILGPLLVDSCNEALARDTDDLPSGKSVRHLGILLSATAQEAATEQMFDKRGEAIRLRINAWSRFDLSGLGRLHVAKQVLASSFYYHASFRPDALGCLAR